MRSRRQFLAGAALVGGTAIAGLPRLVRADPLPETATVRLPNYIDWICHAPAFVAESLLRAEGFTDIRYIEPNGGADIASGELDFDYDFAPAQIALIEAGAPITVLAGQHAGCLELIANDTIHGIKDLKGRRVASYPHLLLRLMVSYVGLDPERDILWVKSEDASSMELFATGQTDAFLGIAPEPQKLRARNIGHTIFDTSIDRPWSQYFCCTLVGTKDYVQKYPVATKRIMRAMLKAQDLCASQPEAVAQQLVDAGFATQLDYALQTLKQVPIGGWREYDAEDTIRFYALRMHEAGMISSSPEAIIANGTDWKFINELKRELKI